MSEALRLVWPNWSFMTQHRPLGREGTFRHWIFYVLLGGTIVWAGYEINSWRKSHQSSVLVEQIEKVLDKSIVPQLTIALSQRIDERFDFLETNRLQPIRNELTALTADLVRLRGDLRNLELGLPMADYKATAQKLGIVEPTIRRVSLLRDARGGVALRVAENQDVFIQYTILGIKDGVISVRLDGRDWRGVTYENNRIEMSAVPGRVYDLSRYIPIPGVPPIRLAVLAQPSPTTLDVAIGPARTS